PPASLPRDLLPDNEALNELGLLRQRLYVDSIALMQIAEELQPAPRIRRLRVGIDTGGTFTDIVAIDEATGEIFTTKTPSTPHDPSVGVLDGIRKIARLAGP